MIKFNNKEIDFRVSICPTYHGENLVIRILDKESLNLGLESLGFPAREFIQYTKLLNQPYGLILVTGPTGSGKTTSLYASVRKINRENINIMTVENPIEYALPRIRQVQVNDKMGLTFASILRSFLRQDPDIIMIGEIRDAETADIAVQAALTGHLVLSSLHTNDTPTAFSRLTNMNIEPFLIASAVKGVIAQRLLRKVCPKCKTEYVPSLALLKFLNLEDKVANNIKLVWGKGCDNCNNTGYKGRIGIFEFLPVTPEIQNLVADKKTAEEIRREAIKQGMKTLRDIAAEKLIAQLTSAQEVIRITQSV
jgi:type IV pilus assembly protein PilB